MFLFSHHKKENNREIVVGQVVSLILERAMFMLDPLSTTPLLPVLYLFQLSLQHCYLWIWLLAQLPLSLRMERMTFSATLKIWWIFYHPNLTIVNLIAIYPKSKEDYDQCWRFKHQIGSLFFFVSMPTSLQHQYTLSPLPPVYSSSLML